MAGFRDESIDAGTVDSLLRLLSITLPWVWRNSCGCTICSLSITHSSGFAFLIGVSSRLWYFHLLWCVFDFDLDLEKQAVARYYYYWLPRIYLMAGQIEAHFLSRDINVNNLVGENLMQDLEEAFWLDHDTSWAKNLCTFLRRHSDWTTSKFLSSQDWIQP